jgi:hypothetical protein
VEAESRNEIGSQALVAELLARIESDRVEPLELSEWLVSSAGDDPRRRRAVGDAISSVARTLAPADEPPSAGAGAAAWQALVTAADALFGSGVHAFGRLPFLSHSLLALLVSESRSQRPPDAETGRRTVGEPGRALAGLAVSRQLRESISDAFGFAVVPSYEAIYLYEPPGSHVRTHVDASDYEIVFHLILEHVLPADGSGGSALVVHRPDGLEPAPMRFEPGEAVTLRGRGTIHSWEPLREGERRTLTAVGFERS